MAHIDSVYNFGKCNATLTYLALQGFLPEKIDARLKKSTRERLASLAPQENTRAVSRAQKFTLLNNAVLQNLDSLQDSKVLFIDPVSPNKVDPKFVVGQAEALGLELPKYLLDAYMNSPTRKVMQEPYAPLVASTDAMLMLAALNPKSFDRLVVWPISPVHFPSIIDAAESNVTIEHAFADQYVDISNSMRDANKIGFGNRSKSLADLSFVNPPRSYVGSFEANANFLDARGLEGLLIQDPMSFAPRIAKLSGVPEDDVHKIISRDRNDRMLARTAEDIRGEVQLQFDIMAHAYATLLSKLNLRDAFFFGPKGGAGFRVLDRAAKICTNEQRLRRRVLPAAIRSTKEFSARAIGPNESGSLDTSKRTAYRELEESSLRRLEGWFTNQAFAKLGIVPTRAKRARALPLASEREYAPCIASPIWCRHVDVGKASCPRVDPHQDTDACSKDLYDHQIDPDYFSKSGIDRSWFEEHNSASGDNFQNTADLVDDYCRTNRILLSHIEEIAIDWLNFGPNHPVFTSTEVLEGETLSFQDKRRVKARSSWYLEKGEDLIVPFVHEDSPASNAKLRMSSLGSKCLVSRVFAMFPRAPPLSRNSHAAARGTAVHALKNESIEDQLLLEEKEWERLGLSPIRRSDYSEKAIHLTIGGTQWSGHSDGVFLKGPREVVTAQDYSGVADLFILDFKTSQATYLPQMKHVLQLVGYGIAYTQLAKRQYPNLEVRNLYAAVVARPISSQLSAISYRNERMHIVRVSPNSQDSLYVKVMNELEHTVEMRASLTEDRTALEAYIASQESKGACEERTSNFSKCGCFDSTRAQCYEMRNAIGDRSLAEYLKDVSREGQNE